MAVTGDSISHLQDTIYHSRIILEFHNYVYQQKCVKASSQQRPRLSSYRVPSRFEKSQRRTKLYRVAFTYHLLYLKQPSREVRAHKRSRLMILTRSFYTLHIRLAQQRI